MELCSDDEEASRFFVFLILQRLPAWLRVQLEADDQADIRQQATRADRCSPSMATSRRGPVRWWTTPRSRMTARRSTRSRQAARAAASGAASVAVSEVASGEDSEAATEAVSKTGVQQPERLLPAIPPPSPPACAGSTGGSATRRSPARAPPTDPAAGRETDCLGVFERRHPWFAGAHCGSADGQAFPSRYWSKLQHFSASIVFAAPAARDPLLG